MKILLDGILESLSTRSDGSVSVKFSTQELDSSKGGELFQLRGKYCKALFSDTNITDLEASLVDSQQMQGTKSKSKSQRLRAVLFRYAEQHHPDMPFETFYDLELENIITHYKSKLQ